MTGIQHPHDAVAGATPGDLMTWSCRVHDTFEQLDNGEAAVASISVDAHGHITKARSNALGHTLESVDQEGFISTVEYDAAGNSVTTRDPNSTGYDAVFDELNRGVSTTDRVGSQTQTVYDKAGQAVTEIDAKGNNTGHHTVQLRRDQSPPHLYRSGG